MTGALANDPALIPSRWRLPARAAFITIVLLTAVFFAAGLPEYYRQLTSLCPTTDCFNSPTAAAAETYRAAGLSLEAAARWVLALDLNAAFVSSLVALLIFWRRPDNRVAWLTALMLFTFGTLGIHSIRKISEIAVHFPAGWQPLVNSLTYLGGTLIVLFFMLFPNGHFAPRWLRWPFLASSAHQLVVAFNPGSVFDPAGWPLALNLLYWAVVLGACVYSQLYHFRRVSNYAERQQTKWVVLGIVLSVVGSFGGYMLLLLAPLINPAWAVLGYFADSSYYLALSILPLSIGFAMFRSRLWDVDVVINRALVYGLLTVLLAGIYAALVIGLQALFTRFTGQTSDLALIGSTLAIVALFQPLRRSVSAFIARRFYRRHYDGQQVLTAFAGVLRDQPYTDPDDLSQVLLNLVDETIQPAHVSLRLVEGTGRTAPKRDAGA